MDVNVNERKVHKVHIQDKKVEQRADRCSLQSLENDVFLSSFDYTFAQENTIKNMFSECNFRSYCI